jgi:hypothetical protein
MNLQLVYDLASATVVKLSELKHDYSKFYKETCVFSSKLQIETPKITVLSKEPETKKRKRNDILEDVNLYKPEETINYKKRFDESIDLYIKEIQTRFEPIKIKPLFVIYNLLIDDKLNYKEEDISIELKIYSNYISFTKLYLELEIWYCFKKNKKISRAIIL